MALLQDKVVIVTGSSSGIGLATANLALQEGAKVFGVDISPPSEALTANENYKFLQCNVTDSTAPAEVVAKCAEVFGGRVDVLLNVAGVMDLFASADTVTDEMWDRCIAINLTAPVKLMREVLKVMKEQKSGSIVNVGSKAGTSGAAAGVAYTASKHGLLGASKNVAWRFKAEGIRCNCVLPGGTATNITSSVDMTKFDMEAYATLKLIQDAHMHGSGTNVPIAPEEIAQTIIFLASDRANKISGAMVPIDVAWSVV